ncbi:hypothetical protein [Thomasclavelia cocleata]|uniref:hypothetical protein n=1 Tax=Thomasclavelia cocleata TaxID=69824 RepID=UPI0025770C93|nr:hypothetical protein [Thomasclavelia cocleata]
MNILEKKIYHDILFTCQECYYDSVVFWLESTQSQDNFSFLVPFLIIKISKKAQFSELFYFRHCSTRQGVKKEEFLDKTASTQSFLMPPFKLVNLFRMVSLYVGLCGIIEYHKTRG